MPVLITGATGFVGRALATRLLAEGAEVRAYIRRDDPALRAAGVHIAIGGSETVEPLEAALTNVHTIVHLVGGWWPEAGVGYDLLNRDSTETAVIAAKAARVKRFVFLSFPGAEPRERNEFLAAKGRAEEHITTAGVPFTIFRCAPIWGEGAPLAKDLQRAAVAGIARLPGRGGMVSLIGIEDVVDALVAADSRDEHRDGIWDLGGPVAVSMEAVATAAGIKRIVRAGPLAGGARWFADLLGRDTVVDPGPAAARFGLSLRQAL